MYKRQLFEFLIGGQQSGRAFCQQFRGLMKRHGDLGRFPDIHIGNRHRLPLAPVSYTHLDVYKRQLPERATFLARHCSIELPDGQFVVACDPWHRVPSPQIYRIEEVMACWREMTAPVMLVTADEGYVCLLYTSRCV